MNSIKRLFNKKYSLSLSISCKWYILFLMAVIFFGCSQNQIQNEKQNKENSNSISYSIESAPKWTALFNKNSGWFGADGIFSIPKSGIEAPGSAHNKDTFLFFSDTMIGEAIEGSIFDYSTMVNNSVAIINGDDPNPEKIDFYWSKDENGEPKSIFTPQTPNSKKGEYYWLGDGFVNTAKNNQLYIFAYRIQSTDTGLGFEEVGNVLIIIPAESDPPFKNHRQIDTPLFIPSNENDSYGSFGAGVFVNTESAGAPKPDGYVYVYGVKGQNKDLLVARVSPKDFEDFDKWEYRTQNGWDSNIESAYAVTQRVSNELSVYPISDQKYALIFQMDGIGSKVAMRIGESPVGPFGPIQELWNTEQVTSEDKDFFAYNAKAHPNLSKPGELLISYNVNSFDFLSDINTYPNLYRPRFIRFVLAE